ncbi:MAG: multiheme c-type cytochrome [Planctomycetota bacterium]|nr:multiheme c-type cytochrome [Planctomycetota bacterium]
MTAHPSRRFWIHAAVLLSLTASCGDSESEITYQPVASGTIHILQMSRLQGIAGSIPCNRTTQSPLAGAALLRDVLVQDGDLAILTCIGETLSRTKLTTPHKSAHLSATSRAETVLEALGDAQVDVYVPGHVDLALGWDRVVQGATNMGIDVIITNAEVEDKFPALPYKIYSAGGPRVALLGVIPSRVTAVEQRQQTAKPYDGVVLHNVLDSVQRTAAQIRESGMADIVIVLSNVSQSANNRLMDLETVDLVVGTQDPSARVAPLSMRSGTALARAAPLGKEVGHTVMQIANGSLQFADLSVREIIPRQTEQSMAKIAPYLSLAGIDPLTSPLLSEEEVTRIAHAVAPDNSETFIQSFTLVQQNTLFMKETANYTDSYITHGIADLPSVPDHHPVNTTLAKTGSRIREAIVAANMRPTEPLERAQARIPKAQECVSCHAEQVEFWRETPHADAFVKVDAVGQGLNIACVECHTTGYGVVGGYDDIRLKAPLDGVGCYHCHETNNLHVENPRFAVQPMFSWDQSEQMNCLRCHTQRRSPGFDKQLLINQVACPSMDLHTPQLDETRRGALELVEKRRRLGTDGPADTLVEALAMVGLGEAGWDQTLVDLASGEMGGAYQALAIARILERRQESHLALDALRGYLMNYPGDEPANLAYLELLLFPSDPTARDPEAALSRIKFLIPKDSTTTKALVDFHLYEIDALFMLGRATEGESGLAYLIHTQGNDPRIRERYLRWMQSQR